MLTTTQKLTRHLKAAEADIRSGELFDAINRLRWALRYAQEFPADCPRYRCRRAYIAQAIQALEQVHANS